MQLFSIFLALKKGAEKRKRCGMLQEAAGVHDARLYGHTEKGPCNGALLF